MEELNKLVRPEISEDAPVAEPEEHQTMDENSTEQRSLSPCGAFPDLVWLKISSKIEDLQDWLNLYSVSSKLMKLLENDKFEKIFPKIFSHVRKYLKRKDVINLFGADEKIAKAILPWIQNECLDPFCEMEREDWEFVRNGDNIPAYSLVVNLNSRKRIKLVTKELLEGGSDYIPFGICFMKRGLGGMKYWEPAKKFLRLFGTRIWFCSLYFLMDENEVPDMLIECLQLIPNVIRLELTFQNPNAQQPIGILIDPSKLPLLPKLYVLYLARAGGMQIDPDMRILLGDELNAWHAELLDLLSITRIYALIIS